MAVFVVPCWAESPIVKLETNFIDGYYAIVGAHWNDDNGTDSGSAYILTLCPDADLDGDCSVTLNDLAILSDNWLLH
jgi:hypothetical protein